MDNHLCLSFRRIGSGIIRPIHTPCQRNTASFIDHSHYHDLECCFQFRFVYHQHELSLFQALDHTVRPVPEEVVQGLRLVNETLQTSDPDIFAVGEVALRDGGDPAFSGTHERAPDGFLIAYGTAAQPGRRQRGSIVDVTPTVLYFLGLAVARDMDGFARADLFTREFTAERPIVFIPSYSQ